MKRFVCLFVIFSLIFAVKYSQRGLLNIDGIERYYEYKNGTIIVYEENIPVLSRCTGYTRVLLSGGVNVLGDIMSDLSACVLAQEEVGEIKIYYAYSEIISIYETVFDYKINVMIAITNDVVVVGSPLLVGSY